MLIAAAVASSVVAWASIVPIRFDSREDMIRQVMSVFEPAPFSDGRQ